MTELIDTFIRPLSGHGLRYMVTGSVASMVYGEPRLTNDIDVVLEITTGDIPKLIGAFPESAYYLPSSEVIETELLRGSRGHLNIISQLNLLKADIYLVGMDPVQRWGMDHARTLPVDDLEVSFAPPEYVIVRKLEYYREGRSEKHLRDIASMLTESLAEIDFEILCQHVARLGLKPEWEKARALAES